MKHKTVKNIILVIVAALMLSIAPQFCAQADESDVTEISLPYIDLPNTVSTVKVGLRFNSSAMASVKLENYVGLGFEIGYYDNCRVFHGVADTSDTAITITSDGGWTDESGTYTGAAFLLTKNAYTSYEEALKAISRDGEFAAYIEHEYKIVSGPYADADEANAALDDSHDLYYGTANTLIVRNAEDWAGILLFDCADTRDVALLAEEDKGNAETMFAGYAYHGGFAISKLGDGRLNVINYVDIEDYVKGVLPYEMMGEWPAEALKAQAVCARTYVLNNIDHYSEYGFDVRSDTYSQVYRGTLGATESTDAACEATAGEYVRYDGTFCKIYYMSADGGQTETGANVFSHRRSYLQAVTDTYETEIDYYNKTWSTALSPEYISELLSKHGISIGAVDKIAITASESGNVIRLDFTDINGNTASVSEEYCFRALNLNSLKYTVSEGKDDDGNKVFVFSGSGWGHNCGMSQWGAYSMALNHESSCMDIISFYFSGAYVK